MTKRNAVSALLAGAMIAGAGWAQADEELVVFDWAGYEDPNFFQAYVEKYGGPPTFAFFGDEEEAFQKMRAGFTPDLAHPCSQSVAKWREAGLLAPLDTSKIEAWDDASARCRASPPTASSGSCRSTGARRR